MKVFKILAVFATLSALLVGCGGGGGGNGSNPGSVTTRLVTASPSVVVSGNTSTLNLSLTDLNGKPIAVDPTWSQDPAQPAGVINPSHGQTVTWTAPTVEQKTVFVLNATVQSMNLTQSTQVTVLPPGSGGGGGLAIKTDRTQVNSGNEIELTCVNNGQWIDQAIAWSQVVPDSPTGSFDPPQGNPAKWFAPQVTTQTAFTLKASVTIAGAALTATTQITVNPGLAPSVTILTPTGNNNDNIVGSGSNSGVTLTVKGWIQQGNNPIAKIEAIVDDQVVASIANPQPGSFQIDVKDFGSPGSKNLTIKATDSVGLVGIANIPIIISDSQLNQLTINFLSQYAGAAYGVIRFGNKTNGPFAKPVTIYLGDAGVQQYHSLVQEACDFWTKYTGIQFQVIDWNKGDPASWPSFFIVSAFNQNGPGAATSTFGTVAGSPSDETDVVNTTLYQSWYTTDTANKIIVLAHEIGRGLVITSANITDKSVFDYTGSVTLTLYPFQQKATQILYSHNPGDHL